jgi:D-3-phosphoglycerate dehydrogenase
LQDYLPTPPPESNCPAKEATIYVPTPIHPEALAYARERFGRVIMQGEVDEDAALGMADAIRETMSLVRRVDLT